APRKNKLQSGYMLLEVLIGILVFSLGILGLLGMQAIATKSVLDARSRSEAGKYASQLIGEMWLNRANLTSYAYPGSGSVPSVLQAWHNQVTCAGSPTPPYCLPGAGTAGNLPVIVINNPPTLAGTGASGNEISITIYWQAPGGDKHSYQTY